MKTYVFGLIGLCVSLTACGGSTPLAPSKTPAQNPSVATVSLTPTRPELPIGGGSSDLTIATSANNVAVSLSASSGTLSSTAITTNGEGRATVTWTGTSSANVTANAGGSQAIASIAVAVPPTPPPANLPGAPTTPPPPTTPQPDSHTILHVTVDVIPGNTTTPSQFSAVVIAADGSSLGTVSFLWDFESDGSVDSTAASPSHQFGGGKHSVTLTVFASEGRVGVGTALVFVDPPPPAPLPAVAVGLTVTGAARTRTFTTTLSSQGPIPAAVAFAWDFETDGTVDLQTTDGSATHTYPVAGAFTATVRVTLADGRVITNTIPVLIP